MVQLSQQLLPVTDHQQLCAAVVGWSIHPQQLLLLGQNCWAACPESQLVPGQGSGGRSWGPAVLSGDLDTKQGYFDPLRLAVFFPDSWQVPGCASGIICQSASPPDNNKTILQHLLEACS